MIFDVRDYGAVGDGKTLNTKAIQACIDACAAAGGGRVLLENGVYVSGTVRLKSFIDFHIASNATFLGSEKCEDFPSMTDHTHIDPEKCPRNGSSCFILAEEAENVSLSGMGKIDGNGQHFIKPKENNHQAHWKKYERIGPQTPPRVVFFCGCRHARIENIGIYNSPSGWAFWIHDCDDVVIHGVTVDSNLEYPNNDGIHINCSRDVAVSDCNIKASDDALVVRANSVTLKENKVCERVSISNCNLISHCGGIRIGWLRDGVVRNCTFSDLSITDTRDGVLITFPWRGPDAIPDEGREDSVIENISFHNIVMDRIHNHPIHIKVDDHENTRNRIGSIDKLYFTGIRCRGLKFPSLEGSARYPLSEITFTDCTFDREDRTEEYGPLEFRDEEVRFTEVLGKEMFAHVNDLTLNNTRFRDLRKKAQK